MAQEEVRAVNQDFLMPFLELILRHLGAAAGLLTMTVRAFPLVVQI
jgi:hypothetical protein